MSTSSVAKRPRAARGGIEWKAGSWHAKVSVPGRVGNGRKRIKLQRPDGTLLDDREHDEALARQMAKDLSTLVRGDTYEADVARRDARIRVRAWGLHWTSGGLYREHGNIKRLRPKASARDDANRLELHVYPYIGDMAVADVREQDIEQAFKRAGEEAIKRNGKPLRSATRTHIYQVMHRMFDLAIKPGRLRADNPVSEDLRPEKDAPKLFAYLYPSELIAVLACEAVPLVRRVYYALAVYVGLRKSSLRVLHWHAFDFEHLTLTSLVSKTDLAQIFALSDSQIPGYASIMVLLRRYYEFLGRPDGDELVIQDLQIKRNHEAKALRDDLRAAGVTRALLFSKSDKVEPLRFHDLRATFVTWAKRAGKSDGWITDRTGQITPEIMRRYARAARVLEDLRYEPFPDISTAVPELSRDLIKHLPRRRR